MRAPNRTLRALCLVIAAAAVILAAAAEKAEALPRVHRYVSISVSPQQLDLGTVPEPGVFDSPATLTVHVAANCAHGGVVISMADPLDGPGDATIPLNRIWVKLPTGPFVPLTEPVVVTGPMNPGVVDVLIKFRVETDLGNPPGTYLGTLVVTCGVAP